MSDGLFSVRPVDECIKGAATACIAPRLVPRPHHSEEFV